MPYKKSSFTFKGLLSLLNTFWINPQRITRFGKLFGSQTPVPILTFVYRYGKFQKDNNKVSYDKH